MVVYLLISYSQQSTFVRLGTITFIGGVLLGIMYLPALRGIGLYSNIMTILKISLIKIAVTVADSSMTKPPVLPVLLGDGRLLFLLHKAINKWLK